MKIKYLLILMFLLCFFSTAFGQVKVDSNYKNDELIKTTSPKKSLPIYTTSELMDELHEDGRETGEDTVQGDGGWEYQGDYGINESEFYFSDVVLGDQWLTWGRAYYRVYVPVGIVFEDLVVGVRGRSNDNQYNAGGVDLYLWNWNNSDWDSDPICHIPGDEPSGGSWYGTHITSDADKYVRSSDGRISMYYEYNFDTSTDNDDYHIDWVITRWEYEPVDLDLEITSVSISPTPPLDENESFTSTVYFRNNGEGDAGGFWLDFFMDESSTPSIPCDGDFYTWIPGLAAGASSFFTFSNPNMYYGSPGTKHQYYVIDSYDYVPESNENNNVYGPHDVEVEEGNISITLHSSPSGLKVKVDGSNKTTPYYTNWEPGSSHELEGYTQNKNNIKYAFVNWENGSATNPRPVSPTTNKIYTANYNATHYYLDIDIQGQGSVSPIEDYYPINSTQTLTATPSTGWTFSHWSDDISTSDNPCYINMNSPKSVTAHFVEVDGIQVGNLVVKADNYNPELTEAWGNVKIKHIQNADYLVSIQSGHAYVNLQNNTITIEDDDNFGIVGSSYWNFSGTSWNFDCNAGTATISTNLNLVNNSYIGGTVLELDFQNETLTGYANFHGIYTMLPELFIKISFGLDYFEFKYEIGEVINISNNIVLEIFSNYFSFKYNMSDNTIEFDASLGNIIRIKYVDNDDSEFYFCDNTAPATATIHIKWYGNQYKLVFTDSSQVGIHIPVPIGPPKLREYLGDEEYDRLLQKGYICEIKTDGRWILTVSAGLTIEKDSFIQINPLEFDIQAELYVGASILWGLIGLEFEVSEVDVSLDQALKLLSLEIASGDELKINGLSVNLDKLFYGENDLLVELFWGNNNEQLPYYKFDGDISSPYGFLPCTIHGELTSWYLENVIEGNGIVYFLGIIPIYNASIVISDNGVSINGHWLFGGKDGRDIDTLNVLWESDFTYKTTRCTFLERITPVENYENFLLEKNSFVYYDTTNASFFSLNSKYDGIDLNWQPYFDEEDDLKFDLIKIDGLTLSMASDADMRLESVEDSSRYIEIKQNGEFKRNNVNDLLFSCVRTEDPETGRKWKIISVKSMYGKSLNENFKVKLKEINNTDTCYFSYINSNTTGKTDNAIFVTYEKDNLESNHSYSTYIYTDGTTFSLVRDDLQNPIENNLWDIGNTTLGFSFNYISGVWNAIYDTLTVNVNTSEPSDCWLYYGPAPDSLPYTIQSSDSLPTEHQFKIYKDDIHSRWFYKIEASKEDGNTIYAGPLIVPPRGSPTADFSANPTEGEKPLEVVFTDLSEVGPTSAEITSWEWDFDNDGTIDSYGQNPTHTYPDSGHYTVSLKVTDTNEESDTKIVNNMIEVWEPPIANFSADPPLEGEPPLEVGFTDESTTGSGDIISWYWEFGDDSTSTEQNPVHTYTEEDNYDVTLTIIDSNGLEDSITKEDFIFVRYKPIADFSGNNTIGVRPLSVQFIDESYNPGIAEIIEWYWEFGDGADTTYTTFIDIINHTYQDSGHYTVSLKVTDTNDVSDTKIVNNMIEVWEPPVADFSAETVVGEPPLEVQFYDDSIPGSGDIISWYWEFGDGSTSTEQNPVHTYTEEDNYDVTLTIIDSNGLEDSITKEDFIFVRYKPIADFSAVNTIGEKPLIVTFTDESEHPGIAEIIEWYWDFGDGADTTYTTFIDTINHTYPDSGHYTVLLKVTDTNNVSDTKIKNNYIEVWEQPIANFSYSPSPPNGPPGLIVHFYDNSQAGSGEIVFWHWKFGDGVENYGSEPSVNQNPEHTYHDTGIFSVTLIIKDSNGLIDSLVKENIVHIYSKPVAKFSASPLSGEPSLEVQFRDESISGSGDINYWKWDFGDGQTSNVQDPKNVYEESGIYTVSLIVKDTFNQVDDTTKINLIKVAQNCFYPNPYNPESGIIGTFRYTPKSSGNYTITIYDVSNQIVIELDCGSQKTNEIFEFNWNGKNASEKDVANGTYFYIIKSNTGDSYMNKLSILK
ncbi:MAG: PKD domain-containing protein [Candidatus Cloacimonetes bacterium]|nr:PKD domain-containing protein [Candidatus Cloacimonadota bacterium]